MKSFSTFSNYSPSIVPMFLLMGHFATLGGISKSLFNAAESWLGHPKRRAGNGIGGSLRRVWSNLRLVTGHRRHDEQGCTAGNERLGYTGGLSQPRRWPLAGHWAFLFPHL